MTTSVNISFFISADQAASAAEKKDYRSTAYNNYSADLVDLDNEVCTIEVEASSESEATDKAERIAFEMGIQVSYINIYKV